MGELINGRTPEEIKLALRCCRSPMGFSCKECPYNGTCLEHEPEIDALALIEHLEAQQPKWISVKERLPNDDARYLVYMPDYGLYEVAEYWGDGEWLTVDSTNLTRHVSNWMPLPSVEGLK